MNQLLTMTATLQLRLGIGTEALCAQLELPASSVRRWRRRQARGLPLFEPPGPKKLQPLPFDQLHGEIEALRHGTKRTRGSTALHQRHRDSISRRDLRRWIRHQREVLTRQRRHNLQSIRWNQPHVVWAIDITEYGRDRTGRKLFLVVGIDLASRFLFAPLVTLDPTGREITEWLRRLFRRHQRPLFLKRDNGSNLNCETLDAVLAEDAVIPLNSPPYYPPYNGGIEKGIGELKTAVRHCLCPTPSLWNPDALTPIAAAAAHLRNATPRRCLGHHSPVQIHHQRPPTRFTTQERHDIFRWLTRRSAAILAASHHPTRHHAHAAWRAAAQLWLQRHHFITIHTNQNNKINQPVSPHFNLKTCS